MGSLNIISYSYRVLQRYPLMLLTHRIRNAPASTRPQLGVALTTHQLQFQTLSLNKIVIGSDTRYSTHVLRKVTACYQVNNIELVPRARNCDDLFYKRQVYWWEPTYLLTEVGTAKCHWAKPKELNSNGKYMQYAEKLAHTPLMFTDELTHTDPDNGVRVVPYDSGVEC